MLVKMLANDFGHNNFHRTSAAGMCRQHSGESVSSRTARGEKNRSQISPNPVVPPKAGTTTPPSSSLFRHSRA